MTTEPPVLATDRRHAPHAAGAGHEERETNETLSPENMPGLDLAYGFVHPSYQWALSRFEAGDTRLQTLQAVVTGVSLPVPAFAKLLDESLSFEDPWFMLAAAAFLAAMAIGVAGRLTGTVKLAHLKVLLHRDWLTLREADFKYSALCEAAAHFDKNAAAIRRKWRCALAILALFGLELSLLVGWTLD